MAEKHGWKETVELLLSAGADPSISNKKGETVVIDIGLTRKKNNGDTQLHRAAWYGKAEMVKLLLERGADIDMKNKYGDTPIHQAAENGRTDIVKVLLSAGADPYITNKKGETACDVDTTR